MDLITLQTWITRGGMGLVAVAVLGGLWAMSFELRAGFRRRARLAAPTASGLAPATPSLMSGVSRAARRLGQQAALADPKQLSQIRSRLVRAGYFNRDAVIVYLGVRAVAMIAATIGTLLLMPLALARGGALGAAAVAVLLAAVAVMGPDQLLKRKQGLREREYAEGFPDLLDLLVASVEAGLSLDAAVSRVSDELERRYPALAAHLRILTLELRAGRSRKEAWTTFAERLGIDDARQLATMLRQAEEMGTSLGETLSVFATDMRSKRMLRAEEKALALPAKLTVPLIFFIFPCLLAVVMMPAGFKMAEALSTGALH